MFDKIKNKISELKSKFGAVFVIKDAYEDIRRLGKMKSGIKTTEFWLAVLSIIVNIYNGISGMIPADTLAQITIWINVAYTIARAIVKATESKRDDELLDKINNIVNKK